MSTEDRIFSAVENDLRLAIAQATEQLRPMCESEIEVILGATMILLWNLSGDQDEPSLRFKIAKASDEQACDKFDLLFMPQYPWNSFRIDWCIRVIVNKEPRYVFVECDGHDFHERTKDQAERDRAKDRAIQAAGIPILRFTGREIYRDASACCAQILRFATMQYRSGP